MTTVLLCKVPNIEIVDSGIDLVFNSLDIFLISSFHWDIDNVSSKI